MRGVLAATTARCQFEVLYPVGFPRADARLCRDWLDKLHGSVGEREDRNELLNELIVHVKAGILNRPFNEFPTDTSLSAIKVKYCITIQT